MRREEEEEEGLEEIEEETKVKAHPNRREIFAAVATATISPKFRVDCGKEIRVVIHTNATVSW